MGSKKITVTESQLNRIISESVRRVLSPASDDGFGIDISKIPIEDLRAGYRDLRLTPIGFCYDDVLGDDEVLREDVGDIMNPDEIAERIRDKYDLPKSFVRVTERFHKIYIFIVNSPLGMNDKMLENDMRKAGYFMSNRSLPKIVDNMMFQTLQFEPECQLQDDVTDEVRGNYTRLYHWTPSENLESIMKYGIIPLRQNVVFNYPNRAYLIFCNEDDTRLTKLGKLLYSYNRKKGNNGDYALLGIDVKSLPENVRLYYDPNCEIGVYTEQPIPVNSVKLIRKENFRNG